MGMMTAGSGLQHAAQHSAAPMPCAICGQNKKLKKHKQCILKAARIKTLLIPHCMRGQLSCAFPVQQASENGISKTSIWGACMGKVPFV